MLEGVARIRRIATGVRRRADRLCQRKFRFDPITGRRIQSRPDLRRLGSDYGGWIVPMDVLSGQSVCYCAGVGLDATFDLELVRQFGCEVVALDPTPRAREYVAQLGVVDGFTFVPIGLWDRDEILRFYAPADPSHVSHSVLNLQRTQSFFEASCKRLAAVMDERGCERIDLLKLDIEGAEYRVLQSVLADRLPIRVLCVEFDELHHPLDGGYRRRIRRMVDELAAAGFTLVALELSNYTFVRD